MKRLALSLFAAVPTRSAVTRQPAVRTTRVAARIPPVVPAASILSVACTITPERYPEKRADSGHRAS